MDTMKDRAALYELLHGKEFIQTQIQQSGNFAITYALFHQALKAYSSGCLPEEDARLCYLALKAGRVAKQAQSDIEIAFTWAEEGKMEQALLRLNVLQEVEFYKAALLLLWLEAERQRQLPVEQRRDTNARMVIAAMDKHIPQGSGAVEWDKFLPVTFILWWANEVAEVLTGKDIGKMIPRGRESNEALLNIAVNLAEAGKDAKAREVVPCIESATYRDIALSKIEKAAVQTGESLRSEKKPVQQLLQEDLPMAMSIADVYDKAWHLFNIAKALVEAGEASKAKELFQQVADLALSMEKNDYKSHTLRTVAKALAQMGAQEQASQVFQQAIDFVMSLELTWEQVEELAEIAKDQTQVGAKEKAKHLFQQALDIALAINYNLKKSLALSRIAQALAAVRDFSERSHFFQQAIEMAMAMKDADAAISDDKSRTLFEIAQALAQAGEKAKASEVFRHTIATPKYPKYQEDVRDQANITAQVARALAQAGEKEKAWQVFEQAIATAQCQDDAGDRNDVQETDTDAEAMSKSAQALARVGDFQQAIATAKGIQYAYDKSMALAEIAKALAQAGDKELAKELFGQAIDTVKCIEKAEHQSSALVIIAQALGQAGEFTLLPEFLEKTALPAPCVCETIRAWQRALLEYCPNSLPHIRRTFLLFPFDYRLAYHSVRMLQLGHLRQKHWEHYQKIEEIVQEVEMR